MNGHAVLELVGGDWPGHGPAQVLTHAVLLGGLVIALYAAGSTPPAPHHPPPITPDRTGSCR